MAQRWRAVGNSVSDLTGPRLESQNSHSRDERVTTRPKPCQTFTESSAVLMWLQNRFHCDQDQVRFSAKALLVIVENCNIQTAAMLIVSV